MISRCHSKSQVQREYSESQGKPWLSCVSWEQRKLGDVGVTYTGLSGKTKEDFGHGNGTFVTYMNVFSNTVGLPDMVEPVEIDDSQNKVLYGDVLFTTSSETPEEVGMSSVWLGNAENTYLNSFCFGYRPMVEFNPYYLAYMLRSSSMRKNITFLAQGISRYNISKNKMMDIEMPIPNIEEQKQIGSYFCSLDNLITLHQHKYDKLLNIKKSMLEKMFPRDGSKFPEIRFSGFTDPWEQRKLSEIATMHARIGWQNLRTSEFLDQGDYMLITGTDFDDGRINYSTCHYVEKERYNQDPHIQIQNGSILITKDGTLGKVAFVQGLELPATLNAGVFNVEIIDEDYVDGKYLFQYLKAPFLMDYVGQKATGGTIKHLNQNILVNFPVVLPKIAEHEKIGEFFESIDHLITLHQRKQF